MLRRIISRLLRQGDLLRVKGLLVPGQGGHFSQRPPVDCRRSTRSEQHFSEPDTPSERASNERHERHFSVKISPVTPTLRIMRTHKTAGQDGLATGSRIATHSTWWVIGNP
jgi:hypothetical protein